MAVRHLEERGHVTWFAIDRRRPKAGNAETTVLVSVEGARRWRAMTMKEHDQYLALWRVRSIDRFKRSHCSAALRGVCKHNKYQSAVAHDPLFIDNVIYKLPR